MKFHQIMLAVTLTASAFAGTATTETRSPPANPPVMGGDWFFGVSYGRLSEVGGTIGDGFSIGEDADSSDFDFDGFDFDMYSLHLGRNFGDGFYGFNTTAYLEVAYLDGDTDVSFDGDPQIAELLGDLNADIDIVPVTVNLGMERNLIGGLGLYLGAGLGYAFTDSDVLDVSDTDGGFYAQASAGLVYNFTEKFEMFGGARWLYLDSLDFGDSSLELDDEFAWEIGARVNF
jgi:hypothetical protein